MGATVSTDLVRATSGFAVAFHAAIAPGAGNLAASPASLAIALAMTWAGARGQTADEVRAVLGLVGDRDAILDDLGGLARVVGDPASGVTLRMANRLFGARGLPLDPGFVATMRDTFAADLEPLDLADAAAARRHINTWVAARTEGRIAELLPDGAITPLTRLLLVNALYFLGRWAEPFAFEATRDAPFTIAPGQTRQVPTMHAMRTLRLARGAGGRVLELPYAGGGAAMWIALPDRVDGLADLEASLDATTFGRWRAGFAAERVAVALPRFTVDPPRAIDAGQALTALGMPTAFDGDRADFTGMSDPADPADRLYLADVFHQATVIVDERGTEAAAASAARMAVRGASPRAEPFVVDRPFLFAIVDRASGLVLFLGRVVDPTAR